MVHILIIMIQQLKIHSDAKKGLEWIKEFYSFRDYTTTVETVVQFFKINNVSPRDTLSNNLKEDAAEKHLLLLSEFKTLNATLKKEFKPLIEIYKAVERDQLKPIHRKIDTIYTNMVDDKTIFENATLEKKEQALEEVPKLLEQIKKLKVRNDQLSQSNSVLNKLVANKDTHLRGCVKYLSLIFSRVSKEKNSFGKDKIILDVSDDERKEMNAFFDSLNVH